MAFAGSGTQYNPLGARASFDRVNFSIKRTKGAPGFSRTYYMFKEIFQRNTGHGDYFNNEKSVWISALCYLLALLLLLAYS